MASFYGGIFSAYKNTKIIGSTTLVAAIINLVINIFLIKAIGIYAAAFSTLVSSVFLYIYRKNKMKELVKLRRSKDLSFTILITLIVFLAYYSNNVLFQAISLLFTCIYALMMNKSIVRGFLEKFIRR